MLTYKSFTYAAEHEPLYKRVIIRTIENLTGKIRLWNLYRKYNADPEKSEKNFWSTALQLLNINVHFDEEQLRKVPRKGPLVIIANHPYGVLDGLCIGYLASKIRPDYRVLTNSVLCRAEEIEDNVLPVDFSPTKEAWEINLESRQKARALLKLGGCLVIFPAGGVSMTHKFKDKHAWDNAWQSFTSALIQGNKTDVLPIYFEGQNSRLFQWASLTSQTLRLALFFREVARRINTDLFVKIGDVIPHDNIKHIKDREALCHHLWTEIYTLGGRKDLPDPKPAFRIEPPKNSK